MVVRSRFLILVSVLLLCSLLVSSASAAQTGPISPGEFREKLIAYAAWLDSNTSQDTHLQQSIQAMDDEAFQALYDSFAEPDALIAHTEQVMASVPQAPAEQSISGFAVQNAAAATMLYTPDYPQGSSYDVWVASLPGFGLLSDGDGDGSTANDRCSTDGESEISIVGATFEEAGIVADVLCETIVVILGEGTNAAGCVAAGVLHTLALTTNNIVASQCSSQDGLVDSAEIEAAYENSKIISGQVDGVSTQIDNVSVQLVDIAVQIEGVSSQIKDVSTQLATHDTEIKAILAANHTETINLINANQAQSLKIEIEKALADTNDNKRLSYFYLPQAQGGLLELVRQTVLEAINANQAAGIPVGNAQSWFAKANASFASQQYKTAFDQYGRAYVELVK